jgi:hypothetical protein
MKCTELNRREETTVYTEVEYDFDWEKKVVEVAHFMPKDEEEIQRGIQNRWITEEKNLQNNLE